LERLNTEFLDLVYLHDAEYVASPVFPEPRSGYFTDALDDRAHEWGLSKEEDGKVHGEGDQMIIDAIIELFKMKKEGIIKSVGISGGLVPDRHPMLLFTPNDRILSSYTSSTLHLNFNQVPRKSIGRGALILPSHSSKFCSASISPCFSC
jgi:hypothetical protein